MMRRRPSLHPSPRRSARAALRRLVRDRSGVSMVEFAIIAPVLLSLGLAGSEVAWMASTNMQVSQIALSLADNAARLGQTDNSSVTPTVTENDVNSIMTGALMQGSAIKLGERGRIVLSSLEYDSKSGKQFIHWQRCRGSLDRKSAYGDEGSNNGLGARPITGVGQAASKIRAADGSAVMVVEVYYQYENLFANVLGTPPMFRQEAVFAIRDDRNLAPGVTGTGRQSQCS